MPIIVNKTIHSFSSEDPAFPAKNLLENNKTARWKCATPGEESAFVVLKFDKPYLITKIDIGNEHSGIIGILVANSKQDPPDFKELILSNSFMLVNEVRNDINPNRVKFFEKGGMIESVANERHDLLKIFCRQPFTNRYKYGVAFITIYTSDEVEEEKKQHTEVKKPLIVNTPKEVKKETPSSSSKPKKMIGKFAFRDSSSDDDNDLPSPFQQYKLKKEVRSEQNKSENRKRSRSSSNESPKQKPQKSMERKRDLKFIDSSDDEIKPKRKSQTLQKRDLCYDSEDDKPNERLQKKIDIDRKRKEEQKTPLKKKEEKPQKNKFDEFINTNKKSSPTEPSTSKQTIIKKDLKYKPFNKLLEDVTFVMSGYQNPERGILRQKAIDMGARYKADWDDSCTHLICAFVNTPKFNQVKGKGKIVSKKWIEACFSEQKKIPWRRYATDWNEKKASESEDEILCEWHKPKSHHDNKYSDSDEDMVVVDKRKQNVVKIDESDDDDMIVVDKRKDISINDDKLPVKATVAEKEEENEEQKENLNVEFIDSDSSIDITTIECQIFKNKVFYLNEDLPSSTVLKFTHLIRNMLGVVTKNPLKANYIITKDGRNLPKATEAEVVKDTWIQECHDLQAFIPTSRYRL